MVNKWIKKMVAITGAVPKGNRKDQYPGEDRLLFLIKKSAKGEGTKINQGSVKKLIKMGLMSAGATAGEGNSTTRIKGRLIRCRLTLKWQCDV